MFQTFQSVKVTDKEHPAADMVGTVLQSPQEGPVLVKFDQGVAEFKESQLMGL